MSDEALAVQEQKREALVPSVDLSSKDLPDLASGRELPADLTSQYWTPEEPGEFKLVFFQRIEECTYVDQETGDVIKLPCAILLEQKRDEERSLQTIRNGAKRLVAALEEALNNGSIEVGTPMKITFTGKERNKTNSFMSDRFSIRPLSL